VPLWQNGRSFAAKKTEFTIKVLKKRRVKIYENGHSS
jgi:hypothetical protein